MANMKTKVAELMIGFLSVMGLLVLTACMFAVDPVLLAKVFRKRP
jgi:hypothetical protein